MPLVTAARRMTAALRELRDAYVDVGAARRGGVGRSADAPSDDARLADRIRRGQMPQTLDALKRAGVTR